MPDGKPAAVKLPGYMKLNAKKEVAAMTTSFYFTSSKYQF